MNEAAEVDNVFSIQEVDVCKDFTQAQQKQIMTIVNKHEDRFASKLTKVGELKVEPYRMALKDDARPKKVAPYTFPREANEWLKGIFVTA